MHTYYAAKDEYTEKCRSQAFYFLTFDTFHKYNQFFLFGGLGVLQRTLNNYVL